jgi:hypothetical protein
MTIYHKPRRTALPRHMRVKLDPGAPPVHCTLKLVCDGAVLTEETWAWSYWLSGDAYCRDCTAERQKQYDLDNPNRRRHWPEPFDVTKL